MRKFLLAVKGYACIRRGSTQGTSSDASSKKHQVQIAAKFCERGST